MLAQVDLRTFGQNLFLIIGGLLLLSVLLVLAYFAWMGLNMLIFYVGKWRAEREHARQTRRADGELYPPMIEGICEVCKRGGHKIYFPEAGKAMCPLCYEQSWGKQAAESKAASKIETAEESVRHNSDTDDTEPAPLACVAGAS